jgi:hypothetical protein
MEAVRRACFVCFATVYEDDAPMCERGHDSKEGWYVAEGDRVIGLGHEHLPGYLTRDGIDLRSYRLLGALKDPQLVLDLNGRTYITQAVVSTFPGKGARVLCLDPNTNERVLLKPSKVVRPLPRTKGSAKLLRAMFQAVHEAA